MTAKDNKTYQSEFKARMRKAGLTHMALWVPVEDKQKLREYAKTLCAEHEQRQEDLRSRDRRA